MEERRELLEAAFVVALATGGISGQESTELRTISNFMWIDPRDYNEIRLRMTAGSGEP
jgi:hypothetical protein